MRPEIDADLLVHDCAPAPPAAFVDALLRTGFSPEAYRDAYGDLRARDMNATEATAHYLRHGLREGRHAPFTLDPVGLLALARLPLDNAELRSRLMRGLWARLMPDLEPPFGATIARRWPVIRSIAGARPFFLAGDSHSTGSAIAEWRAAGCILPVHMLCHGASAHGLLNPDSRSGYGETLRDAVRIIDDLPRSYQSPFLFQFGQVDIEFVHHFHRVRDGLLRLDLDADRVFCAETVQRYVQFLTGLFDRDRRCSVFLLSAFPPALSDEAWRLGRINLDLVQRESEMSADDLTAGLRTLEFADLRQRTAIHAHFNALLQAASRKAGFQFVDVFTPFLGADGLLDPQYLLPEAGGFEHHLDMRRTREKLEPLLWDITAMTDGTAVQGVAGGSVRI